MFHLCLSALAVELEHSEFAKEASQLFLKKREKGDWKGKFLFHFVLPPRRSQTLPWGVWSTVGFYSIIHVWYHLAGGLISPTALLRKAKLLGLPALVGQEFLNLLP